MTLKGKVALVTGSSTGIGEAVAMKLADKGVCVVINSRSSTASGSEVAKKINAQGGSAIYIQADVSNPNDVSRLFSEVESKFHKLDILINNAGGSVASPFHELTKEKWIQAMNDNLTSAVLCSIEASALMKKNGGGFIVNTSSARGLDYLGFEDIMAYSAAKAGVNNFTKTLAKELAPFNITVNAVAPGFVKTNYIDRATNELKQKWLEQIPINRFIEPTELAEAYIFLCSSTVITGTILIVDGGFSLKLA